MIFLIITTSIYNKYFSSEDENDRRDRYLYSIQETLHYLPLSIKPIIVENNGQRDTYLDKFYKGRNHVKVFYTNNNTFNYKNKFINEVRDIKEIINKYGIEDDDIIIKLTGRYHPVSSYFFNEVIKHENTFDVFAKFFDVSIEKFTETDIVLGCYAIRARYLNLFNELSTENYKSAEIAFAKYVLCSCPRIKKISHLDIECCFADNQQLLLI